VGLAAIAKRDRVEVPAAALDAYVDAIAQATQTEPARARDRVKRDPSLRDRVHAKLLHQLTLQHLLKNARVTWGEVESA
jgi:FKBP-type peptidyl-prolyl cis-trans isomerase (trigger factor)